MTAPQNPRDPVNNNNNRRRPRQAAAMPSTKDHTFEIDFYERVLKRDPDSADALEAIAGLYTETGRIADGLAADRRLVALRPDNALAHYNLACSLALTQQPAAALTTLERAITLGYTDADWMQRDPDLKTLHSTPAFQKLLQKINNE